MTTASDTLGIDVGQLRELVIRPTLQDLGLWSPVAENLVLGTGIIESRLKYLKQLGAGPALGVFQMEPFTHNDIWRTTLWGTPLGTRVGNLIRPFNGIAPDPTNMVWNLRYAAAMCRAHYRRIREELPSNNAIELARYWKRYYNTPLGAGSVEKAISAFAIAVNTGVPEWKN
jgi:hypothetical protein